MTVRGGKNKVFAAAGVACSLVALVLLYHNASSNLNEARLSYDKCHLNEESLSAQLQVIIEHKIRLEKSLQQEKSDHAQAKEELQNKVEEERLTRERENLESINKFTALQQQYKLLQSQHEDVTQELEKSKHQLLTGEEERSNLENKVSALSHEVKLLQEGRESDTDHLKRKLNDLTAENNKLKNNDKNAQLSKEIKDLQRELMECLQIHSSDTAVKEEGKDSLAAPFVKRSLGPRSSTVANKVEIVSGAAVYFNTSTPMINPDALQSQDRVNMIGPVLSRLGNIPALPSFRDQGAIPEPELKPRPQIPQPPPPQANEIPRNHVYNYQAEYDKEGRKEEDDDDVDQIDYPNPNEKVDVAPGPVLIHHGNKHDSVMVNPK